MRRTIVAAVATVNIAIVLLFHAEISVAQNLPELPLNTSPHFALFNGQSPDQGRLNDLEGQLQKIRNEVSLVKATSEIYDFQKDWIDRFINQIDLILDIITYIPFILGIVLFIFRRAIYKVLARPIEEEINQDIKEIREKVQKQIKKFEDLEIQLEDSGKLMRLVRKQLDIGLSKEQEQELGTLMKDVPDEISDYAFYLAKNSLLDSFRNGDQFNSIKRTQLIFKSIIDTDKKEEYFRTRAHLAYAYAYEHPPNLNLAIELLNSAIDIRNRMAKKSSVKKIPEYYFYEFKRAIYKIKKDTLSPDQIPIDIDVERDLETAVSKNYYTRITIKKILSQEEFEEEFDGRYISRLEYEAVRKWLEEHPEAKESLSRCVNNALQSTGENNLNNYNST